MYTNDGKIWVSYSETPQYLELNRANRHGLIAGATGTGKTTTLRVLAESFSAAGVPVFISDIKGDLTGLAEAGNDTDALKARRIRFGVDEKGFAYRSFPVTFWDVFGEKGHPVRATISEMGPVLLANILNLSDAQEGILQMAFKMADENGLLLLDLKDLRSVLQFMAEHAAEMKLSYGNITKASLGALLRSLLQLENDGAESFFGEPALDMADWMRQDEHGYGYINLLECEKLFLKPKLYATFMLWMLNELYESLPEAGDIDKPKIIFFFDEAHLLFDDAPKALIQKIEQVVRLVRSKGVGVYFVTQTPNDIPDSILAQLGNRIQHALRAFTPNELKKVKAAADTFRSNPHFDTQEAIMNLGIGEALVSFLDEKGMPSVVERSQILLPQSKMGPLSSSLVLQMTASDNLASKYDTAVDRESAYELLLERVKQEQAALTEKIEEEKRLKEEAQIAKQNEKDRLWAERELLKQEKEEKRRLEREEKERRSTMNSLKRSVFNTVGREVTRRLTRSLFGLLKK